MHAKTDTIITNSRKKQQKQSITLYLKLTLISKQHKKTAKHSITLFQIAT